MDLMDSSDRIPVDPWFQGRLHTRIQSMKQRTGNQPIPGSLAAWVRPALLTIVIVLNLTTVYFAVHRTSATTDRQQCLYTIMSEYHFTSSSGLLENYSSNGE